MFGQRRPWSACRLGRDVLGCRLKNFLDFCAQQLLYFNANAVLQTLTCWRRHWNKEQSTFLVQCSEADHVLKESVLLIMALKNSPKAALLTTIRHRNNGHCKAQKCTFYSSWWEPLTYRPDSGERVGGQQNWPATWGPVGSRGARARRAPGQRPFLGGGPGHRAGWVPLTLSLRRAFRSLWVRELLGILPLGVLRGLGCGGRLRGALVGVGSLQQPLIPVPVADEFGEVGGGTGFVTRPGNGRN